MRLSGKVALISGAAKGDQGALMGIGGVSAWLFVREGASVVLVDIDEENGQKTAAQIVEQGGDAVFQRLDVVREADWVSAIETVISRFGRLDILVNSVSNVDPEPLANTTVESWRATMDIHAMGTMLGMKHSIPHMRRAGGGSIINISSIDGIKGQPIGTAYASAKGAVRILTKQVAAEVAQDGIRVNSIHPGYIETPLAQAYTAVREGRGLPDLRLAAVPLGRLGVAEDIANGVLYLASDESSYMTGAELVIDGGITNVDKGIGSLSVES